VAGSGAAYAKKKSSTAQSAAVKVLSSRSDAIAQCASLHLGPATPAIVVSVQIAFNNLGQVVVCDVSTSLPSPNGDALRGCVEKVLRGVSFPKSKVGLTTLTKEWRFSIQ
jgi:hypothetical protein